MTHPVLQIIEQRAVSGSEPGRRDEAAVLGLCIEGGAMRGVVSAGMVSAIERLQLLRVFDIVVGASAGAANGAYLVAGQAAYGTRIYFEDINTRSFIDPARLLVGRPVVDLDFLVDDVMRRRKVLDTAAILRSAVPLAIVASDLQSGESQAWREFADGNDLLACLRASTTMPILAGAPYAHRGGRFWDGSMAEPVPIATAARLGCTHVLALLTRPPGEGRPSLSIFERYAVLPRVRRISPAIAEHFAHQDEEYARVMAHIDAGAPTTPPCTFAVRPSGPPISNLERRADTLKASARDGFSAVLSALSETARFVRSFQT